MFGNLRFGIVQGRATAPGLGPKPTLDRKNHDMEMQALRAELEQLFELDDLLRLSERLLGFEPKAIGGDKAKGSFVRALTEHCKRAHALEALCDAVVATKPQASYDLRAAANSGVRAPDLSSGEEQATFRVIRKIGAGPAGIVYQARLGDREVRLKLLHPATSYDARGMIRYLTFLRVLKDVGAAPELELGEDSGLRFVAQPYQEGVSLTSRLDRGGPVHSADAADWVRGILTALTPLHERHLVHGDLKLENVLLHETDADAEGGSRDVVTLLDAGTDRLRSMVGSNGHAQLLAVASPKTVAPEVLAGEIATPRSDIYAVGAMLYELLTQRPPFEGESQLEQATAHLGPPPPPPSDLAPRGAVPFELDAYVLRLLSRDPSQRPANAADALNAFDSLLLTRASAAVITEEELSLRLEALADDPLDQEAALALESAADEGGDALRIAEAFQGAYRLLQAETPEQNQTKLELAFRAGRLFRRTPHQERAEGIYAELLVRDPHNKVARAALEDLRRRLGKNDELIDMWIAQSELAESSTEKAELMAKIGALYEHRLNEPAHAIVAYTQAYGEHPSERDYVQSIERLARTDVDTWTEVLTSCAETAQAGLQPEDHNLMLVQMGTWYGERLNRFDLALDCFQNVLGTDAANEGALDGLARIYRKAQQWPELAQLLLRRADAAATPESARGLRAEAAEILDRRLGDSAQAQQIYERIIEENPAHEAANEALANLYQRTGDHAAYVKVLKRQADNLRDGDRLSLLCRVGEAYEDQLASSPEAVATYKSIVSEDPLNLSALRGLDRMYSKLGQYDQLLTALEAQVRVAATPRQKATLYERIGALYEEEFLDIGKAAETLQAVLEIDERNDNALTGLERIYRTQQRWDELLDLLGRHAGYTDDPRRKAQLLYQRATLLADQLGSPHQAIVAYEAVVEVSPDHSDALTALAELKQQSGDADEALRALDTLANSAASPNAKADSYLRGARLLEKRSDLAGAVERYKLALDAVPNHGDASRGLRDAYVRLGQVQSAVDLLENLIAATESSTTRGKLTAELAKLAYERLGDRELAKQAAEQALEWHDTSIDAQEVLAALAMDDQRYDDAVNYWGRLLHHTDSLPRERAVNVLVNYLDALTRGGSDRDVLGPVQKLRELAPDNPVALLRAAKVVFDHGSPEVARDLYTEILERFDAQLSGSDRMDATYYHAEATRRVGQLGLAVSLLEEAADMDPTSPAPLRSLVLAYTSLEDGEGAWEAQSRLLDIVEGDDKVQLLIEMGELAMDKLDDRQRATRCLVAAVDVRPDDRRLLTRLMQLYSEEKDWAKAVDVVLKLAEFVDDPKQKARYLMTAGMVSVREMGDHDAALQSFSQVIQLDPSLTKALEESISIHRDRGDHEAAEALLKEKMRTASEAKDTERLLESFMALGELYRDHMNRLDDAVDAFEAAHTIDPDNRQLLDILGDLYASIPGSFDKAVQTYTTILEHDPYRADAYSSLRKLYTEAKNPDGAWLLCQALFVLKLAAPDEERFFKRMRSDDPAYAQETLFHEDWARDVLHPDQDPLLTDIFAVIEPAVIASRGYEFEELGYDPRQQVNLEQHRYPIGQTIHYAAGVMDMPPPPCFENTNDPGGLVFLDTKTPSISMGVGVLNSHLPPQMLAFLAAHHLSYYRPGHFLRQLVGTGTGLKSWLFAAIKLISPTFPLAPDLEGAVADAVGTLSGMLGTHAKDELTRAVSKLLQASASLDLKKWVTAVDLSADRAGLLLAHDLETAVEVIRSSEDVDPGASQRRLKEIVLFAIGPNYLHLRERLGINLSI
jgi:tetratricopeptide (TPR) repeat protein